jgi:hypothetical protein
MARIIWRSRPVLRRPGDLEADGPKAALERAYAEWRALQGYFQEVTDPDLVDQAIYLLQAAESRYRHCLNAVRGVKA